MSQFLSDLDTEEQGRVLVTPLLESWTAKGYPLLWTESADQAEFWQREIGDVLLTRQEDDSVKHYGIELKTEQKFTGNLFIETWSNRSFGRQRQGWIYTSKADFLVTVFIDVKAAVVVRMSQLFAWCFELQRLRQYAEHTVKQSLNGQQLNKTTGVPVSIDALSRGIEVKCFRFTQGKWQKVTPTQIAPKSQIALFDAERESVA